MVTVGSNHGLSNHGFYDHGYSDYGVSDCQSVILLSGHPHPHHHYPDHPTPIPTPTSYPHYTSLTVRRWLMSADCHLSHRNKVTETAGNYLECFRSIPSCLLQQLHHFEIIHQVTGHGEPSSAVFMPV